MTRTKAEMEPAEAHVACHFLVYSNIPLLSVIFLSRVVINISLDEKTKETTPYLKYEVLNNITTEIHKAWINTITTDLLNSTKAATATNIRDWDLVLEFEGKVETIAPEPTERTTQCDTTLLAAPGRRRQSSHYTNGKDLSDGVFCSWWSYLRDIDGKTRILRHQKYKPNSVADCRGEVSGRCVSTHDG